MAELERESLAVRAFKTRNKVRQMTAEMFMPAGARAAINEMAEILGEVAQAVVDLREREVPAKAGHDAAGVGNG